MTLKLHNTLFRDDGIFGSLKDESNNEIAVTLQHAYDSGLGDGTYVPKVSPGTYICVKGSHRLEHMLTHFTTFEITGVKGHTNILFHVGNYNRDSDGCVLLGEYTMDSGKERIVTHSRVTFDRFMNLLKDLNQFTLIVT